MSAVLKWVAKALVKVFLIYVLVPALVLLMGLLTAAILLVDFVYFVSFWRKVDRAQSVISNNHKASIIVSNWNGRELLGSCLPAVIEAIKCDQRGHEIIVVDDGSVDGSADFVKKAFPSVRLIALGENRGFAEANNIAARESKNGILIFLNNDMVVDRGFIGPLLKHFERGDVFAATCRIAMTPEWKDGNWIEETGLTRGRMKDGFLSIWHEKGDVHDAVPTFYFGGGSSACDKSKFLELGGFDRLYRPFYYEDVDLSFRAWKRGWSIWLEPCSNVYHKHRGTINPRNFKNEYVELILRRNRILFVWRNITDVRFLVEHLVSLAKRLLLSTLFGDEIWGTTFFLFLRQLPAVLVRRFRERGATVLGDREVFERCAQEGSDQGS